MERELTEAAAAPPSHKNHRIIKPMSSCQYRRRNSSLSVSIKNKQSLYEWDGGNEIHSPGVQDMAATYSKQHQNRVTIVVNSSSATDGSF